MTIVTGHVQEAGGTGVRWEMCWRLILMRLLEPLWRAAPPKQPDADEGIFIVAAGAFFWALRVPSAPNLMTKTP